MAGLTDAVRALAEPLADAAGLDLVDVQVKGSGHHRLVRVIVDRKGGVDLGRCQQLSGDLSERLDVEDPVPGGYSLEVTSPGLDHPLHGQRAFDRVEGRAVDVERDEGEGTTRHVRGTVVAAEDDAVVLEVDGTHVRIPYGEIVTARQSLPW